jgi:hypothetical protein
MYTNNHFKQAFAREAYVKAGFKNWEVRGGRYAEIIGEVDPTLSSGSLAISGNALPIPKIGVAVTRYTPVPFTRRWLQFKGQFSHGWLGPDQYVKGAYLHEKAFYLKVGREALSFYGGLTHFAEWGGTHPAGQAPQRFKDYLRIIAGAKGDASDQVYQQGPIDIANAVGNHLLIPDFGIVWRTSNHSFKVYTQTIFEKGQGRGQEERDRLVGLKIFSQDRLLGLSWNAHKQLILEKIVLEGIYTRHQGGPVMFRGRDNYYNNATYLTGWVYQDRIIGTPLFITRQDAANYNLNASVNNNSGWNIVSNRLAGLHLGFSGNVTQQLSYRTLATYVQHYGNYYNDAAYAPYKRQTQLLFESSYRVNPALQLTAALARDFGDLAATTGGLLRVEWFLR